MAFAAGSGHSLRYVAESAFGVAPGSYDGVKKLRHTSSSIVLSKDSFQSNEIRSDRQIADFRHGARRVQGDIGIELSYAEFDDLLAAALFSTWDGSGPWTLKAGVVPSSFRIERGFTDLATPQYGLFTGCMVNTMSLSIPANAMVTGSFGFIGKDASYSATAMDAGTSEGPTANAPYDSFTGELKEGGQTAGDVIAIVTSVDFNIANGLDPAFVVGSSTTPQIIPGRCNITGSLSAYFEDLAMLEKFIDEDESSLEINLDSTSGGSYKIYFPRIKYSGGDNPVSGEGAIMVSMPFQALYEGTTNLSNIVVTKTAAT